MQRRQFLANTALAPAITTSALDSLATPAQSSAKPFTVKAGEDRFNQPINYRGVNPNLVKISGKDTGGQLAVFEYEGFMKTGPELHVHFDQDEIFYVVEGQFLFQVGTEKQTLTVGDTIFLPRNIPHTWLQLSEKGKLIYLLQPAGKLEEFFKKIDALKRPPTAEEVAKFAKESNQKIVGPPLTAD